MAHGARNDVGLCYGGSDSGSGENRPAGSTLALPVASLNRNHLTEHGRQCLEEARLLGVVSDGDLLQEGHDFGGLGLEEGALSQGLGGVQAAGGVGGQEALVGGEEGGGDVGRGAKGLGRGETRAGEDLRRGRGGAGDMWAGRGAEAGTRPCATSPPESSSPGPRRRPHVEAPPRPRPSPPSPPRAPGRRAERCGPHGGAGPPGRPAPAAPWLRPSAPASSPTRASRTRPPRSRRRAPCGSPPPGTPTPQTPTAGPWPRTPRARDRPATGNPERPGEAAPAPSPSTRRECALPCRAPPPPPTPGRPPAPGDAASWPDELLPAPPAAPGRHGRGPPLATASPRTRPRGASQHAGATRRCAGRRPRTARCRERALLTQRGGGPAASERPAGTLMGPHPMCLRACLVWKACGDGGHQRRDGLREFGEHGGGLCAGKLETALVMR